MNKCICIGIVLALAREYVCDGSFKTGVGGEELFYKLKEQECIWYENYFVWWICLH